MSSKLKVALSLGGIVLGVLVSSYYKNIDALSVRFKTVRGFTFDQSGNLQLTIVLSVTNPTGSTFPVPRVTGDLYSTDTYLGYAEGVEVQVIEPNAISEIELVTHISPATAGPFAYSAIENLINNGEVPSDLRVSGAIHLFAYNYYFDQQILGTTPATT